LPVTHPATSQNDDAQVVARLLRQLGADAWSDRQHAEEDLVRMGDAAVPHLEGLLRQENPPLDEETRSRCESALRRIEEQRVSGPSLITLHLHEVTPEQAYAEIARQAHAELSCYPPSLWTSGDWPAVTLSADREPFWQVVRRLAEQTGVGPRLVGDELRIARPPLPGRRAPGLPVGVGVDSSAPAAVSGAFFIVATRVSRTRSIDLNSGDERGDFNVGLAVLAEPKMRVLQVSPVRLEAADDELGHSLLPTIVRPERSAYTATPRNGVWQTSLALQYPPARQAGQRIAHLRGTMSAIIQTRSDRAEIPHLDDVQDLDGHVGQISFTIERFRKAGSLFELLLSVERGGRSQAEWTRLRQTIATNPISVQAPDGSPLLSRGVSQSLSDEKIDLTCRFWLDRTRHNAAPAQAPILKPEPQVEADEQASFKMVWEVPLESKMIDIPFELTDLPMP
jgi:hypothetical protein